MIQYYLLCDTPSHARVVLILKVRWVKSVKRESVHVWRLEMSSDIIIEFEAAIIICCKRLDLLDNS